jgi:hypothetical protein
LHGSGFSRDHNCTGPYRSQAEIDGLGDPTLKEAYSSLQSAK